MKWDDPIIIKRETGTTTKDSESGQPVGEPAFKTIFNGFSRIQQDEARIKRMIDGGERLMDYAIVYLPPGRHGIQENDLIYSGDHIGRVKSLSHFHSVHYTRLFVKWHSNAA